MKLYAMTLKSIAALMVFLAGCQTTVPLPTSQPSGQSSSSPATSTSPQTTKTNTQAVVAAASPYPRRPLPSFSDQVAVGSSFYQFRERLKQAIQDRDATFMNAIADPDIKTTFGPAQDFSKLGFGNPDSLSWKRLERIINIGCTPYEAPAGVEIQAFQCPHISQASVGDPYMDVYILGEDVNVREQPENNSPVIEVLDNELVKADPARFDRLTEKQREEMETLEGWRPIITPSGKPGYVSSRYAYVPVGYRARFENKNGTWKMTIFIAGD